MKKSILVLCAAMMCAANVFAQSASENTNVNCGSAVTITATPAAGYHFIKWTKGGADFAGNTAKSLTVNNIKGDSTYVAHFAANVYDFGEGVTISPTPFDVGDEITLTATPTDDCLEFDKWSDGNTDNPRTITYDGTAPFTVVYKTKVYNVVVNTETGDATQGTVTVSIVP